MNDLLIKIVKSFTSSPVLFIGSGFSRRYLSLPDWKGLLKHFAELTRSNDISNAFSYYEMRTAKLPYSVQLQSIASLIQNDFNELWFNDISFRKNFSFTEGGCNPFKLAIKEYIEGFNYIDPQYTEEINSFKMACGSSIASIITTNYDLLLEQLTSFKSYIGQGALMASTQSGLAEIYKIHGSVDIPNTIILTKEDYDHFEAKEKYLSAKLMTIFLENPVVFIGYSFSDYNIRNLIKTIIMCFEETDTDSLVKFQNKLYFFEWNQQVTEVTLEKQTLSIDSQMNLNITVNKIIVPDFKCIFEALATYRMGIPVKILRQLKTQFVNFVNTHEPNDYVYVADLNNQRIKDDVMAMYIGQKSNFTSLIGLIGKESKDVFLDILNNDLNYSSKEILTSLVPKLEKGNAKLPKNKYFSTLSKNEITSEIIKSFQNTQIQYEEGVAKRNPETRSIEQIWDEEIRINVNDEGIEYTNYNNALIKINNIPDELIDSEELKKTIENLFKINNKIFDKTNDKKSINPTNVRKLIIKLDHIMYYKRAMENLSLQEENYP